jgi:hypothetical protein
MAYDTVVFGKSAADIIQNAREIFSPEWFIKDSSGI